MNAGTQQQTFPYPTVLKAFLYSNASIATPFGQSLFFKSVMNKNVKLYCQVTAGPLYWPW